MADRRLTAGRSVVWVVLLLLTTAAVPTAATVPEPSEPILIAEITVRSEQVGRRLHRLTDELVPDSHITSIELALPDLHARLAERLALTRRALALRPGLMTLDVLAESWHSTARDLATWSATLTRRAVWIQQQEEQLTELRQTWSRTRADPQLGGAPAAVVQRIDGVLSAVAATRTQLQRQQVATLLMQDSVARAITQCEDALRVVDRARSHTAGQLFARDSPPLWNLRLREMTLEEAAQLVRSSMQPFAFYLRAVLQDQAERFVLHGVLTLALIALLLWGKHQARSLGAIGGEPGSPTPFDQPVAAGLMLGMLASIWLYPGQPRLARTLIDIGAPIPMLMILRPRVNQRLSIGLLGLVILFFADRLRAQFAVLPVLDRGLFALEMLVGIAIAWWLLRAPHVETVLTSSHRTGVGRLLRLALGMAIGGFAVALISDAVGNTTLARLVARGIIASGSFTLVICAALWLVYALFVFSLGVRPLNLLWMVRRHRPQIQQRAHSLLWVGAVVAAGASVLDYFGLAIPAVRGVDRFLAAGITVGHADFTIGDVLAFIVTIAATFVVASLVRFVLDQEICPRLHVNAGASYAVATLLRYTIVLVGFLLALVAVGVTLDRVAVLGGAFGLGLGFGLQNVVSNFVSGLIVLLEQPVQVGDTVRVGDIEGQIRRVGIRSSTVRTGAGADVLVPNSMLVAERVTNLTPSDYRRRIDIRLTVAYGTTPELMFKVLVNAAQTHHDVEASPAPLPLFLGFRDNGLAFELQAWTTQLSRYAEVQSELGLAVYAALREAGVAIALPQHEVHLRH